jgi:hypothetical protein
MLFATSRRGRREDLFSLVTQLVEVEVEREVACSPTTLQPKSAAIDRGDIWGHGFNG